MQQDPIGMVKHFEAWKNFASGSERKFPIIFVNLNKMTTKSSLSLLTSFLNVTSIGAVDFTYKPKKRKQSDILEVSAVEISKSSSFTTRCSLYVLYMINCIQAALNNNIDVGIREKLVSGFQFYDKITRSEIDSLHSRLFASR